MIGVGLVFAGLVVALVICGFVIERVEQAEQREAASRRQLLDELDRQ